MSVVCRKRLLKELKSLRKKPVDHIRAAPEERNLLNWHFVINGPDDSQYAGGFYHGLLRFHPDYPYKPPSIYMFTPNGRFKTNTRLCLSMSDFHPESWNPMWSVSSILSGLLSFMLDKAPAHVGSMAASRAERLAFARRSLDHNVAKSAEFRKLFPDLVALQRKRQAAREAAQAAKAAAGGGAGAGGAAAAAAAAASGKDGAAGLAAVAAGAAGSGAWSNFMGNLLWCALVVLLVAVVFWNNVT